MSSKNKKIRVPKLGRRDHQVTPAVEDKETDEQKRPVASNEIKSVSKQVENKKTERELKRIKKIEEERLKAIDKDNRRAKRRMLRKQVRKDIFNTSTESCATFCFVFVVGSTLLGGGTALIVGGRENDVFDFIVVGATGVVCGIIFTATGMFLLIKPVYEKHAKRKATAINSWGEQGAEESTEPYLNKERVEKLNYQIHDTQRQRRQPSCVELYGDNQSFDNVNTMTTPRDESFTSYTNPPFLAVPNNERESCSKNPVLLLDAKEPMSPQKEKRPKITDSSTERNSKISKTANFSRENETNFIDKNTRFSQENEVKQNTGDHDRVFHQLRMAENRNKSDGNSSNDKGEINIDAILKHPSRNTIVIDYSLLKDLESPPTTSRMASTVDQKNVDHFTNSQRSQNENQLDATNQRDFPLNDELQKQSNSDLTVKLYEKHPDIADKHKKRSKKHRRHSEKSIRRQQTNTEITIPMDDSEKESAESMC